MQFSIRSILMLTAICTLAFYAVYQTGQIKEIQGSVIELRGSLTKLAPAATNAETSSRIIQNYLAANPTPSKLRQSVEASFREWQRTHTSFEQQPAGLATKVIPESNAPYLQRHQVLVFVPEDETVQLRMAVFPCKQYRSPDLPPLSEAAANTILNDNPFSVPQPVYIDLDAGEHRILIQWFGETQTITVSIEDKQRYESRYTRESRLTYRNQVLGSYQGAGLRLAAADQEVIGLRTICPGGGPNNDPMEHAWKCELVRGSMLSTVVEGEAAEEKKSKEQSAEVAK